MCTSIVFNGNKTIVGFNFDNSYWKYRIVASPLRVFLKVKVREGLWEPIIGVNRQGDFVNYPQMNPLAPAGVYRRSGIYKRIDMINRELLFGKRSFADTVSLVKTSPLCNEPQCSLQAQDSNRFGDVLQIEPGIGHSFLKRPRLAVMTNFQLSHESETKNHPWGGYDRYVLAKKMLNEAMDDFDVSSAFEVLKAVSQSRVECPTQWSVVYDASAHKVYWCENREWDQKREQLLSH
jgi:hypothetical protein